jgi:hypothetical protein
MIKLTISVLIFLLLCSNVYSKPLVQKNKVIVNFRCNHAMQTRTVTAMSNQKLINEYNKSRRKDRLRMFGIGFTAGSFTVCLGFTLLLFFVPIKKKG